MLHVSVDGARHEARPGATVLDLLRSVGVHVPALCHDDRLVPAGVCRTCLVAVKGHPRPVAACTTPLLNGMEISTDLPELTEARRSVLALLAWRYPAGAARRWPGLEFHREAARYGVHGQFVSQPPPSAAEDRSHPYIRVDMARCIDCCRCVRICNELQGQGVWHVRDRGSAVRIEPDGPSLLESSCVSCGACVDTCPTGALADAPAIALQEPSAWTRTTCPYCGVGCELDVGTSLDRIVTIRPVLDAPVSKGHLCVKGRYAFSFVAASDRVTEPMIRQQGRWKRVSWAEVRAHVAGRLKDLIACHGPDAIGILGSARATNEENYLTQKLARAVIGTNNVDCCARVCHTPSGVALKQMLGAGLGTNSFDDIEVARTLLVWGANATDDHPVVGARIKQAARRGARLIVVDPRRTELAGEADCHLALRPGTNIPLLNAMAHVVVHEGLCDGAFMAARVDGFQDFAAQVANWPPERAAAVCGVAADAIRRAARIYATNAPAMSVHGLGLTEHVQGTDGVKALINLALLTGNVGRAGAGVNPLRGQNNVQGSAHMGCDPAALPGSVPLEQGRSRFENAWGVALPRTRGWHQLEMMDQAKAGRLKGLWAIGYDLLLSNPNRADTARALGNLEVLIVQDLFMTETAREFGKVFLPACSSFEKEGTFMNAERRIQRVRAALRPAGNSKPDWRILCDMARALGGRGFAFQTAEAIWDEVRELCDGARGMSYERLDRQGLQWPCPSVDHPGTSRLHVGEFASGPRATLRAIDYRPSPERVDEAYPFLLTTGRSLYQFNAATMSDRSLNHMLRPSDLLDMAPADADRLGLRDGEAARIVSRYGETTLPVHCSDAMVTGQLFATFHSAGAVNMVTGPHRDFVGTPEYKLTAVRLERVEASEDA
jgi:formate dehydrogenase major subunit